MIFAIGGTRGATGTPQSTNEAYDPTTNRWIPKASMPAPRVSSAAGLVNGILYLVGGSGEAGQIAATMAYDPLLDSWSPSSPLPTPSEEPAASVLEGMLFVFGGTQGGSVQVFDPPGQRFYIHKAQ
jgi:hypothetical protein